jgi:hypothetical protein
VSSQGSQLAISPISGSFHEAGLEGLGKVNEDLGIQQIGLAGMGEALAKSLTRRGFTTAIGISGATELNPLVKARQ